jgi:hypothetical protein
LVLNNRYAEKIAFPVGASLLAKDANDDAGCLDKRGASMTIASKLAPTLGSASDNKKPRSFRNGVLVFQLNA